MQHKSPSSEWIYNEWSALTWEEVPMSQGEKQARADALFEACRSDGYWIVGISDAALAVYPAALVAIQAGHYKVVIGLNEKYLKHSCSGEPEDDYFDYCRTQTGMANILSGEIAVGLNGLQDVLKTGVYSAATRRHIVRNELVRILNALESESHFDARIRDFIAGLLKGWKGHARKAKLALAAETNADLIAILETTYAENPKQTG